jgi:glyoxylate/hydroxypyruvate reductase A
MVPDDKAGTPRVALLSAVLDMEYLAAAFREAHPGIDLRLGAELGALDEIDAAVCWFPPPGLLAQMPMHSCRATCRCAASSTPAWPPA